MTDWLRTSGQLLNADVEDAPGMTVEPYIRVDNVFDARLEPQAGLPEPGRWARAGLTVTFEGPASVDEGAGHGVDLDIVVVFAVRQLERPDEPPALAVELPALERRGAARIRDRPGLGQG